MAAQVTFNIIASGSKWLDRTVNIKLWSLLCTFNIKNEVTF